MLPSLSELHLSSCLLENANPSLQYANFTSLEYLDLSDNDFFSELPNWLFNLSGLYHLNLGENRFHGLIPETLLNLRNLQVLILQNNKVSRTIPNWLCQLGGLNKLDFSWNLFTSSIPITLGNLSLLTILSVANNNLTDSLPESLGQLSNLEVLDVGENSLSGIVSHRNFVKLSKLSYLSLDSPLFIFDFDPHWIPPFALQRLGLSYANLNLVPWLSIPNWIGHDVKALRLRSNEFRGVIPLQICQLSSLIVLDLANNKLSGTIPQCLNNITSKVLINASKSDILGRNT
ncbi:receptor-like protein 35 [Medicago truncatula]|uniref:receptor-like protein 35 n=1 Tax=Medicago truncatula TaxID=3880 RepID=UPI000D2F161A|nr:receptor-like protein 35 [Medicago truncatula]